MSDDDDQGGEEEDNDQERLQNADEETCSENGAISNENEEENFHKFVHDAFLKLVEIKGENGFSMKAFEKLLSWGKISPAIKTQKRNKNGHHRGKM